MARGKQKARNDDYCNHWQLRQYAGTELNGIIAVHSHDLSIVPECMEVSIKYCIEAPYATKCSIQMSCSVGTWQGFDYADAIQSLP